MSKTRFTKDKEIAKIFDKITANEKERRRIEEENYNLIDDIAVLVYQKILQDKLLGTVKWNVTTVYGGQVAELISSISGKEWEPIIELLKKCMKFSYHESLQLTDKICLRIDDGTASLKVQNCNPHKNKFHNNHEVTMDLNNEALIQFIKENNIKIEPKERDHIEDARNKALRQLDRIDKIAKTIKEINDHSA